MNEAATEYVGFWRRALAATIDNLTWFLGLSWLTGDLLGVLYDESPEAAGIAIFVFLSLWFNYFAFSEWRWGQTIGKNATGIEVTSLDGGELNFGQASIRNLLRIVDFFFIGWIMVAVTKRKQRLGDKAAKTVVVRRPPRSARTYSATPPPAAVPPPPIHQPGNPVAGASVAVAPAGGLPAVPWGLGRTGKGLAGGLLLALFLPLLVLPFDPDFDSDGALLAAQALLGGSLLLVAIGIASDWELGSIREALGRLGLRRFGPSSLGWMLLAMLAYYITAGLFASLVLAPEQDDIGGELGVGDDNLLIAVFAVVLIVGLAPISEELFFRGFVFPGLRSRFSLWPAALLAGLVFGLIHAPTGLTTVVPLTALGVVLCWLYDKTGSLWPCVIAHTINNGLALAIVA